MARPKKVAAVKEEVVETAKKAVAEVKEVAAETKEAVKKTTSKCVKKTVKMELQYAGNAIDLTALEAQAVAAWVEKTGKTKTAAKNIELYVKPEENAVYYVIEGESDKIEL